MPLVACEAHLKGYPFEANRHPHGGEALAAVVALNEPGVALGTRSAITQPPFGDSASVYRLVAHLLD